MSARLNSTRAGTSSHSQAAVSVTNRVMSVTMLRRNETLSGAPVCWLVWGGRTMSVTAGDTIIGRDPASGIWIDAPGVSRRHARVCVMVNGDAVTATIEDLGSTNGTFVDNARVTGPAALDETQSIRIGDATLTFRTRSKANAPTKKIKRKH